MSGAEKVRAAAQTGLPAGITVNVTGHDPLEEASTNGSSAGSSVLLEAVIGGVGALVILLFVFGTLPAVLMPIVVAIAAILKTFTLVWALTYITDVSIIVQFLIALVGLGVAIDYALLMIFRFRDELREGNDVESSLVETMTHAGRSVIVSGTTVAIGLLAMVALPLPLLRGMGLGGMLIPIVSVLASLTLLPAMLAVLGERINSVQAMPRRFIDRGHPEDGAGGRWARFVLRRPVAVAAVGLTIVAVLQASAHSCTQASRCSSLPRHRHGDRRPPDARRRVDQPGRDEAPRRPRRARRRRPASRGPAPHRAGSGRATAPPTWHRGPNSLVEAFPAIDGAAPGIQTIIDRANTALRGTNGTLTGIAAVDRDFLHALFGSFPYVLAGILLLTLHPARAGVPLDRARGQGDRAAPPLARRGLRDHRLHLPTGPRLRALGHRRTGAITAWIL